MLRATTIRRKPAVKRDRIIDAVTLDHEARRRRPITLTGDNGTSFVLDLAAATALEDGDAVELEDGRLIAIRAAPERLLKVEAENPARLMRAVWHLGNRHVPAEITAEAVYIAENDAVAEMVRGQGCSVLPVMRPFKPERGTEAHDHHHHDHEHGHHHHHHPGGHSDCGHGHEAPGAHHHEAGAGCGEAGHAHGDDRHEP